MLFKTGDLLIWRATDFWHQILENILFHPGFHSGLILTGAKFSSLAVNPSPSHTYVTFFIDQIYPLEDVISRIWYRPNGLSLHLISRVSGENISEDEAYNILLDYLSLPALPRIYSVGLAVTAYFRINIQENPVDKNYRYRFCPAAVSYLLYKFGYLRSSAILNDLLPVDFYNLTFYQRERYIRIDIFDKYFPSLQWMFSRLFYRLGYINYDPLYCDFIDDFLID